MNPRSPRAMSASEAAMTTDACRRWIARPASGKPISCPTANIATRAPMRPGPAPVSSEIAGTTGAIML